MWRIKRWQAKEISRVPLFQVLKYQIRRMKAPISFTARRTFFFHGVQVHGRQMQVHLYVTSACYIRLTRSIWDAREHWGKSNAEISSWLMRRTD